MSAGKSRFPGVVGLWGTNRFVQEGGVQRKIPQWQYEQIQGEAKSGRDVAVVKKWLKDTTEAGLWRAMNWCLEIETFSVGPICHHKFPSRLTPCDGVCER